ncbi:esterase [Mycobacterium phage Nebkiss]|nr:esterase [Mycobacterium phage Nebkiss]
MTKNLVNPFLSNLGFVPDETVEYAPGRKLDVFLPDNPDGAPVLMFVPGGAWVIGSRKFQGYGLMSRLVDQGWICASIDYRTAPKDRWPAPFEDVRLAYEWIADHSWTYGAGPVLAVSGASAGAHMASLLGLTHARTPDAVVSLYGVYDWTSARLDHWLINRFVETVVASRDKQALREASPIHHVTDSAPPFLILHGDRDLITPVSGARLFYNRLDDAGVPVWYHEVAGAVHGFDLLDHGQANRAIDSIDLFLSGIQEMAA